MIQISYLSQASAPMSADQLIALLMQCRTNNAERGLTGMLLYGNGTFLQVLEGEDAVVDRLVDTIAADPRHVGMRLLGRRTIERRQYADWSMGFERITDDNLKQVDGLRDFGASDFNVDYLAGHGDIVDSLMSQYRVTHWDPLIREIDAKDKVIEHLRRNLVQARGRAELTGLVLESMTSAARQGGLTDEHLRLCESMLCAPGVTGHTGGSALVARLRGPCRQAGTPLDRHRRSRQQQHRAALVDQVHRADPLALQDDQPAQRGDRDEDRDRDRYLAAPVEGGDHPQHLGVDEQQQQVGELDARAPDHLQHLLPDREDGESGDQDQDRLLGREDQLVDVGHGEPRAAHASSDAPGRRRGMPKLSVARAARRHDRVGVIAEPAF
jgi:hypothetical protein